MLRASAALQSIKANGVPLTGLEIQQIINSTSESFSSSEKTCKQLCLLLGNQEAEIRAKASLAMLACLERGHANFRDQSRTRAQLIESHL
ncbi:MAG: hypothetical protein EZS28_047902, partial [Streblomastix strix]